MKTTGRNLWYKKNTHKNTHLLKVHISRIYDSRIVVEIHQFHPHRHAEYKQSTHYTIQFEILLYKRQSAEIQGVERVVAVHALCVLIIDVFVAAAVELHYRSGEQVEEVHDHAAHPEAQPFLGGTQKGLKEIEHT